jgi:hypothetical protein
MTSNTSRTWSLLHASFLRALELCFPFLDEGTAIRGSASVWAGTTCPPRGHRAPAFEEKSNNAREQMQ